MTSQTGRRSWAAGWLSERRRSGVSYAVGACVAAVLLISGAAPVGGSIVDSGVLVLLGYMVTYLVSTATAFTRSSSEEIRQWAHREVRGTVVQRYFLGTAPGPGVSLSFAVIALAVALVWLPGHGGGSLPDGPRVAIALALIVTGWLSVAVTYAVTFYADNLVEDEKGLEFPGGQVGEWSDYVYFAISVMTTFGTTDVLVLSTEVRRTVTTNAVIAFVFNTVTIAGSVSALAS